MVLMVLPTFVVHHKHFHLVSVTAEHLSQKVQNVAVQHMSAKHTGSPTCCTSERIVSHGCSVYRDWEMLWHCRVWYISKKPGEKYL